MLNGNGGKPDSIAAGAAIVTIIALGMTIVITIGGNTLTI